MNFENNSPTPEKVVSAALQFQGKLFTGATHAHALDELELTYPNWNKANERIVDGFMTNTGRFVLRNEAEKIAKEAS